VCKEGQEKTGERGNTSTREGIQNNYRLQPRNKIYVLEILYIYYKTNITLGKSMHNTIIKKINIIVSITRNIIKHNICIPNAYLFFKSLSSRFLAASSAICWADCIEPPEFWETTGNKYFVLL
jgi:hypothetical protein